MILVLIMCAVIVAAVGALIGAVLARNAPKFVLYVVWAALIMCAIYLYLQGQALTEFERVNNEVLVFIILLPLLVGSVITGNLVRQKSSPRPD